MENKPFAEHFPIETLDFLHLCEFAPGYMIPTLMPANLQPLTKKNSHDFVSGQSLMHQNTSDSSDYTSEAANVPSGKLT